MTRQRFSWRLIYLVCLSLLAVAANIAVAQEPPAVPDEMLRKLAAEYLPAEAQVAAFAAPQAIVTRPGMEMLPHEVITAAGTKGLGFDPLSIDVALNCVIVSDSAPPLAGVILHTSEPLPKSGLFPEVRTEAAMLSGKPFQRAQTPMEASHYRVDDHTLIVAMEPMLEKMLGEKTASPLRTLLAKATLKNDLTIVAAIDPMRDMIDRARQQAGEVPPPIEPLLKIPDHVELAYFTLNLKGGAAAKLTFVSQDEAGAKELVRLLDMARSFGKQAALMQIASQPASDDPVEKAMQQYMRRLTEFQADQLKPVQDGKRVELGYKADTGMASSGVMVALLLPALQTAREAARRAQSINNLKQIGLGMHLFLATHHAFPIAASYDPSGKPLLSWRVHILPYLEQEELFAQFHLDEPWDSEHNRKLIRSMPPTYDSPNVMMGSEGKTVYLAPTSSWSIIRDKPTRFADIVDGSSNTVLVVEADPDQAVVWTKPDDLEVAADDPARGLGKLRAGGFLAVFGDGRATMIQIDQVADLWSLFTISDQAAADGAPEQEE